VFETLRRRLPSVTFLRYLGASIVALVVDMALLWGLLAGGTPAAAASALSYSTGIIVHWLISSRLVFPDGALPDGVGRWRQKGLFLMSAFVGLSLTVAIVSLGDFAGLDPRIAKLPAIGISFMANYLLRKYFVFALRA
jgi:putative flippase GtrA